MRLPKGYKETSTKNARTDIANLMRLLESELGERTEKTDWLEVKELQRLRRDLIETLSEFSGRSTCEIEDATQNAR
jgi:hypothetical protein